MERLTIPDVRVDEHTTRRSVIDVAAVREHTMKIYWRLKAYEDTGLTPEEIKAPFTEDTMINLAAQALGVEPSRLRELAEADKDGRVRIIPESQNETCGHCYNFERESGTKHGLCAKRPHPRNRYGKIDRSKKFIVYQTTQSCKLYTPLCLCAERALQEMEDKKNGKT